MNISIQTQGPLTTLTVFYPAPVPRHLDWALTSNDHQLFDDGTDEESGEDGATQRTPCEVAAENASSKAWQQVQDVSGLTMTAQLSGPWAVDRILFWVKTTASQVAFKIHLLNDGQSTEKPAATPVTFDFNGACALSYEQLVKATQSVPDTTHRLGQFALSQPKLRVTDPCYQKDTWCAEVVDVLPGLWIAQCVVGPTSWNNRVKLLQVSHESLGEAPILDTRSMEKLGLNAGVDSGQCGFFDDAKYPEVANEFEYQGQTFYARCCNRTLNKSLPGGGVVLDSTPPAGAAGTSHAIGVVTSSGFGDGGYNVYGQRNAQGDIVALTLLFIGDEEED